MRTTEQWVKTALLIVILILGACSQDNSAATTGAETGTADDATIGLQCGPGTYEENGFCLPEPTEDTSDKSSGDDTVTLPADDTDAPLDNDSTTAPATDTQKDDKDTGFNYECEPLSVEACITECGTAGQRKCLKEWGPCIGYEICNGLDDDCDGLIDNGPDGAPLPEICDGEDNDCDGLVDEDLTKPCSCDPDGQYSNVCEQGVWSGCPGIEVGVAEVQIPSIGPGCTWNENGNLAPTSTNITARVEQEVAFNLPASATLCAFEITGASTDFYYDDELMLLLNNIPLIGSCNFAGHFDLVDGLPYYDWTKIAGKTPGELGNDTTCIAGALECSMPGTQSNGAVSLVFDAPTNLKLAGTGVDGQHMFKMVITGDNDDDQDCHHNGLTMLIQYEYLAK